MGLVQALGEQVAHRARLAAEELAEQRVDAGEAVFAGGLEGPEQEPRHELRGAVRDLPGHPLVVVYDDPPDVTVGEFGCDAGDVAERQGDAAMT